MFHWKVKEIDLTSLAIEKLTVMKSRASLITLIALGLCVLTCKEDEKGVDPEAVSLVEILNQELVPLSADPLQWTDEQLHFLDPAGNRAIVALGEATHGTSEFFTAKHRVFKYLVENHGFKIFAIEADFGESIFINQAVLSSDKSQIETLMKDKMHFWTWKTNEVRDLLFWMCDYNLGKSEEEKVQYWGVDCQYNTYHPDMVGDYLEEANVPFIPFAEEVLNQTRAASEYRFSTYTQDVFNTYLKKVNNLKDSLMKYEVDMIAATSEKEFQLNLQLLEEIKAVSEVMYYTPKQTSSTKNYRDEYMAQNTSWLREYFEGAKIVLWAHNFHVSDYRSAGSMGYHLKADFQDSYETIGFLFSKGTFMAFTQIGNEYHGLNLQSLEDDPKPGSINDVLSQASDPVFTVKLSDLQNHDEWRQAWLERMEYFHMGATYTNRPSEYYSVFNAAYFDRLIYFDRTTAAVPVQ